AKARMVAGLVYERDSLGRGARTFGARLVTGSTIDDVESWPARIGAVTPDQIAAAVDRLLNQGRSVTGILLPDKQS
ncbi:MAG: insulinase family protein, partial [Rhodospirillaceae bacterium]